MRVSCHVKKVGIILHYKSLISQASKLYRQTETRGEKKGGGTVFVNEWWCNPGHITIKERVYSPDLELTSPPQLMELLHVMLYTPLLPSNSCNTL